MDNTIHGKGAKIQRVREAGPQIRNDGPAIIHNDPRPDLDHVSLAISHNGGPIQTATRARGLADAEVRYRAALREYMRSGTEPSSSERALLSSGVSDQALAKIQSEEASTFFRMAKDEFFRTGQEYQGLTAAAGRRPTPAQRTRINALRVHALETFEGASRADALLGGLDPQRGRDLQQMEAQLLRMGFPKDEVHLSSRPFTAPPDLRQA